MVMIVLLFVLSIASMIAGFILGIALMELSEGPGFWRGLVGENVVQMPGEP